MNSLSPVHTARANLLCFMLMNHCLSLIDPTIRLLGLDRTKKHTHTYADRPGNLTVASHITLHSDMKIGSIAGYQEVLLDRVSGSVILRPPLLVRLQTWAPPRHALYSSPGRRHGSDLQKFRESELINIRFSRSWSGMVLPHCLTTVISAGCRGVN